ncbi:hypothetical protein RND71_030372 [Anisodus tanguticus]|uniref:Autophagy-related protein 13 N-terminal domain-containing protein n=1 Tax=Anisodus tanguticus TaxID=243964 RepID=A0AAE1RF69_9SOLA|nr:hypothetical protein RND71_030372 [Anisodus tanguticus]
MDFQSNSQGDYGRFEQILAQFLLKTLHIVLDCRVPSIRPYGRNGEVKKSDKWFNLVLGDRPAVLDNLNFWHRNLMEPMIIDIILVQEKPSSLSEHSSGIAGAGAYTETIIERAEEELMKHYTFTPVDSQQGRLCISVTYREDLSDFNLETAASFPPAIITDYVGSPLADPMRSFPSSSSDKYVHPTSFPSRGTHSSSSSPFQRPHSWTSGFLTSPSLPRTQPYVGSPPLYRSPHELSSSPSDVHGQRVSPNSRLPIHHKATSFDDYQLSPPFSPSPSPSPPTYLSGANPGQSRLLSGTGPVSIPHPMMGTSSRYLSPNLSDPNRHSLPPMSPRSTKHDSSSQESPSGIRSFRKMDPLRTLESNIGTISPGQKISRDARDDSGRFSGLLSSSGSPRIYSRSSSRLSFQDDLDVCDFSCPFIVDDVDTSDSQASENLDGRKGSEVSSQASATTRKSQDAAVGALVHLLRTAPPLRQDSSCYTLHSIKTELEGELSTASAFFISRKASDALEELKTYKDLKDLLLSKSATRQSVRVEFNLMYPTYKS